MAITVIDAPHGLVGELSVVIKENDDDTRLCIHPWSRTYRFGGDTEVHNQVAVAVGVLTEDGYGAGDEDYELTILDREDFIEGILAVFPELKRA